MKACNFLLLNGLDGVGRAGLLSDFVEKTKLKSTLVHFSFPFTHPQLTHIAQILPPSLSSITLTEQAMPVRVEMKELQGRWMCAECVCEINECPPLSLIPIGDVLPGQKCQKRQHNYRSEWRSQCCVWLLVYKLLCVFIPASHLAPVIQGKHQTVLSKDASA